MTPYLDLFDGDALLDRLANGAREGRRPVVFLVGSPLTAPDAPGTPGVPPVDGMIDRVGQALGGDVPSSYQDAFQALLARRGPEDVNRVVRRAVLEARTGDAPEHVDAASNADGNACRQACDALEQQRGGWHLSPGVEELGRLVAARPDHFGRTVLTSNFDPLIEISCRRAGVHAWRTTLHGDGGLEASQADGCHVVHVHGYWYEADTLHTPTHLQAERPRLGASLRRLFEAVTLVVVAYGGWDDVFTRTLVDVVADSGARFEVIWTFYDEEAPRVYETSAKLLEGLRPGIERGGRVTLYGGIDCHRFFRELRERLEPSAVAPEPDERRSPFIVGPPIRRDEDLFGRRAQRDLLRDTVVLGQPVQVLGERRMGKTSLLRWVERHASQWQGRPVAWVNAQGLNGRSPSELVRAVAQSLGRTVASGLGTAAAERTLRELLPCVLLVDEASALAFPGHGFETGFLDTLRAFGQDGELVWVSTSHQDLRKFFQSTGMTSSFLNDAREAWVGQLEDEAVRELVDRGGFETEIVDMILAQAGGFAYGLQWLGDALSRDPSDPEASCDVFARAMEPHFQRWWSSQDADERTLLRQALSGLDRSTLPDRERRWARTLTQLGLLVERDRSFHLPGDAWRSFVQEQGP